MLNKPIELGEKFGVPTNKDKEKKEPLFKVKMSGDLVMEWKKLPRISKRIDDLVKELNALRDIMFIHAGEEVVGVIGEDAFEKLAHGNWRCTDRVQAWV
jgi:hypothetical protein